MTMVCISGPRPSDGSQEIEKRKFMCMRTTNAINRFWWDSWSQLTGERAHLHDL